MGGAYRGWFSLNGYEIANSSRVSAHLGRTVPTSDAGMFGDDLNLYGVEDPPGSGLYIPFEGSAPDENGLYDIPSWAVESEDGLYDIPLKPCQLVESEEHPGFYELPASMVEKSAGLYTPPDGARRFGPGILVLEGECWDGASQFCNACTDLIGYDDSWSGLPDFLNDSEYRLELAPWYTTELPESWEFGGVWVMKVDGFGPTPVERPVRELLGTGGVAGPSRDRSRRLRFEALLIACTNAGAEYGLDWLTCLLRDSTDNVSSVIRYLSSSPSYSGVDPYSLARELHGVVLTQAPTIDEEIIVGDHRRGQQGNLYKVSWEMAALNPYAYFPAVTIPVEWDEIAQQPVNWVHAADCAKPETCEDMPVLFSTDCVPEEIETINTPPPVCGGCLPVGAIDKYSFRVPTFDRAFRCRDTAVTMRIKNLSASSLTLQGFWRVCGTDIRCEDNQWPLQVAGLPAGAELVLDGVSRKFWAVFDGRIHRPVGIVGTPNGAPWRPPVIDRQTCWDFIVQTASTSDFEISMTLSDREP